jgi:hypothetical protein
MLGTKSIILLILLLANGRFVSNRTGKLRGTNRPDNLDQRGCRRHNTDESGPGWERQQVNVADDDRHHHSSNGDTGLRIFK